MISILNRCKFYFIFLIFLMDNFDTFAILPNQHTNFYNTQFKVKKIKIIYFLGLIALLAPYLFKSCDFGPLTN